jgi:hypothetical protein
MDGECSTNGEKRNTYTILEGKTKRNGTLGRTRRRWKNNIKTDLIEIVGHDMSLLDLAQDIENWRALMNTVMNIWVP